MTTTLRPGTRSNAVKLMQQQLAKVGVFKGPSTGFYGNVTKKAVQTFEKLNAFKADGVSDGKTRDALKAAATGKDLVPGMRGDRVKKLQGQLKQLGFYKGEPTGSYGSGTKEAVRKFERKHGWSADGLAGTKVQAALAKEARPVKPPATNWKNVKAPPADYRIVNFRGVKVDVRTRVMVERAESYMKKMGINSKLSLSQGSFNTGVGASAGTHDGGGALDIRIGNFSSKTADNVVKALRMAGFAAWRRGVNDSFSPHIHAIAIGDKKAAPLAKRQVQEYLRGGDGLSGSRKDIHLTSTGHNIGRPVPNWAK